MEVVKKDVCIDVRDRSMIDELKVDIMKDLLDVIDSDDLDTYFLAMLKLTQELGYRLQADPEELLERVNNGA
jgi:hypothetical protein